MKRLGRLLLVWFLMLEYLKHSLGMSNLYALKENVKFKMECLPVVTILKLSNNKVIKFVNVLILCMYISLAIFSMCYVFISGEAGHAHRQSSGARRWKVRSHCRLRRRGSGGGHAAGEAPRCHPQLNTINQPPISSPLLHLTSTQWNPHIRFTNKKFCFFSPLNIAITKLHALEST